MPILLWMTGTETLMRIYGNVHLVQVAVDTVHCAEVNTGHTDVYTCMYALHSVALSQYKCILIRRSERR